MWLRPLIAVLEEILQRLDALDHKENKIMSALDDLKAADADLATAVSTLVDSVNRIDTDFTALEAAVQAGDSAAIEAEVTSIRSTIDAAKAAQASIDTTDPAPAPPAA